MKINEVIVSKPQKAATVQPTVVQQQRKVAGVVGQIAVSDARQPATELEKVLAMRQMSALQKRTDKTYAEKLRQQLANAENAAL